MSEATDKLKEYTIVNNKNKIGKYGSNYYQIMMVKNTEYYDNKPFFDINEKIYMTGIEPILNIYNGSITSQYTFKHNTDANNIRLYIPYPTDGATDALSTDVTNCTAYDNIKINNYFLYRKPHVSDMQILVTDDGKIHIFALLDIISLYNSSTINKFVQTPGSWNRIVTYQQHELTGDTINTTPTRVASFPIYNRNGLKFGKFVQRTLEKEKMGNSIYNVYEHDNIIDFHCGIIDSTHLYCITSMYNGTIEMYTVSTDFIYNTDWKYYWNGTKYITKFTPHDVYPSDAEFVYSSTGLDETQSTPRTKAFNLFSEYVDSKHFYFSYSYYENGQIYYSKMMSKNFSWNSYWKSIISIKEGLGFIIHNGLVDFTWNNKYERYYNSENKWSNQLDKSPKINYTHLNRKYKLGINGEAPIPNNFYFKSDDLIKTFETLGPTNKPLNIHFWGYNDILPMILSIGYYYNSTNNIGYYKFYGNMNNSTTTKIESIVVKENSTDFTDYGFIPTDDSVMPVSGDYYIYWKN